jgi:hypothetical protein
MNQKNKEENGNDLHLHLLLQPDGEGRCGITATVTLTTLDEPQEARFDAEVENLLLQLIQQQRKLESSKCPTNTSD